MVAPYVRSQHGVPIEFGCLPRARLRELSIRHRGRRCGSSSVDSQSSAARPASRPDAENGGVPRPIRSGRIRECGLRMSGGIPFSSTYPLRLHAHVTVRTTNAEIPGMTVCTATSRHSASRTPAQRDSRRPEPFPRRQERTRMGALSFPAADHSNAARGLLN